MSELNLYAEIFITDPIYTCALLLLCCTMWSGGHVTFVSHYSNIIVMIQLSVN